MLRFFDDISALYEQFNYNMIWDLTLIRIELFSALMEFCISFFFVSIDFNENPSSVPSGSKC